MPEILNVALERNISLAEDIIIRTMAFVNYQPVGGEVTIQSAGYSIFIINRDYSLVSDISTPISSPKKSSEDGPSSESSSTFSCTPSISSTSILPCRELR